MSVFQTYGAAQPETGVRSWGPVASGTVEEWAAELGCTAGDVLGAIGALDVTPLVDTAENKGREDHDRPTAPELRSLALWHTDAEEVARHVGAA
jgi:hypothetical protein